MEQQIVQNLVPNPPRDNMKKLEFLTGMRGLLAFQVLIWHIQENITQYKLFIFHGSLAVGGFFVLSSFLLTYKLITQFVNVKLNQFSKIKLILLQYYIRRIFRIIPLYMVIVCINIYMGEGRNLCNVTFDRIIDYFALSRISACWLWTIHPEFYWYFQIPFVAFVAAKTMDRWILFLFTFGGGALLAFFIAIGLEWNALENLYFTAGSLLAVLYYKMKDNQYLTPLVGNNEKLKERIANWFSIGFGLLGYYFFIFQIDYNLIIHQPPIYNYCLIPILLAYFWVIWWLPVMITNEKTVISDFFKKDSFFYYCGEISFGLYLIHVLVNNVFTQHLDYQFDYIEYKYMLEFLVVFFLAHYSYKFLEKPLMNYGEKLNKRLGIEPFFSSYTNLQ